MTIDHRDTFTMRLPSTPIYRDLSECSPALKALLGEALTSDTRHVHAFPSRFRQAAKLHITSHRGGRRRIASADDLHRELSLWLFAAETYEHSPKKRLALEFSNSGTTLAPSRWTAVLLPPIDLRQPTLAPLMGSICLTPER